MTDRTIVPPLGLATLTPAHRTTPLLTQPPLPTQTFWEGRLELKLRLSNLQGLSRVPDSGKLRPPDSLWILGLCSRWTLPLPSSCLRTPAQPRLGLGFLHKNIARLRGTRYVCSQY